MDPTVVALLRQLTSSQQAVSQLHAVLSAMDPSSNSTNDSDANMEAESAASSPAVTLNSGGAGARHTFRARAASGSGGRGTRAPLQPPPAQQQQQQQQQRPTAGGKARQTAPATPSPMPTVSLQKYEQLERLLQETDSERRAALQRVSEMESELQRLGQRVEQLSGVVQDQRQQQQVAADAHQLALDEARHTYEAVLRRKEEVHEESLRQVLKSRQLLAAARKFEDTVRGRQGGLTDGAAPINVRLGDGGVRKRSADVEGVAGGGERTMERKFDSRAVKRERSTEKGSASHEPFNGSAPLATTTTTMGAAAGSGSYRRGYAQTPADAAVVRLTANGGRGVGGSNGTDAGVDEDKGAAAVRKAGPGSGRRGREEQRRWEAQPHTPLTPAHTTSPTVALSSSPQSHYPRMDTAAKSTTLLHGRSGPTSRRRRTPRTPSLTNADRMAGSRSPPPPLPPPGGHQSSTRASPPWLATPTPLSSAVATKTAQAAAAAGVGDAGSTSSAGVPVSDATPSAQHRFVAQYDRVGRPLRPVAGAAARGLPPPAPSKLTPTTTTTTTATTAPMRAAVSTTCSGASSVVGGPTRSPSPVNPKRGPRLPRRFIFTALTAEEQETLSRAIERLGDDAVVLASGPDEPPPFGTTHVITRGSPRSVKALCGVVAGKWLVAPEYVMNSLQAGFWLDEYDEGTLRLFPPPLKGQRFLLSVEHAGIREKLAQVVQYGGGEVVGGEPAGRAAGLASGMDERSRQRWVEQGIVVLTSGDDLLRYAMQSRI